jgi:mono/diheme cytochrome c family protein
MTKPSRSAFLFASLTIPVLSLICTVSASAQQAAQFFRQNCANCHTIGGGRLTGPDLKDVTQRKDRAWLAQFVPDPKAKMDAGDPYALQLKDAARGVVMPTIPGLTPAVVNDLLDLIEAESKLPQSQFAGLTITDRPFTAAEVVLGRDIFTGVRPLANGGPPCISCHTVGTMTGLGGGRLAAAPQFDLTRVYERLGGRKATGSWLMAPPTPTMQALFRNRNLQPNEILPLLAFVEDAAAQRREADSSPVLNFFLFGMGGMVVGLVFLGAVWRNRLRAVRRTLVKGDEDGAR